MLRTRLPEQATHARRMSFKAPDDAVKGQSCERPSASKRMTNRIVVRRTARDEPARPLRANPCVAAWMIESRGEFFARVSIGASAVRLLDGGSPTKSLLLIDHGEPKTPKMESSANLRC
jgi:hypothetical protein